MSAQSVPCMPIAPWPFLQWRHAALQPGAFALCWRDGEWTEARVDPQGPPWRSLCPDKGDEVQRKKERARVLQLLMNLIGLTSHRCNRGTWLSSCPIRSRLWRLPPSYDLLRPISAPLAPDLQPLPILHCSLLLYLVISEAVCWPKHAHLMLNLAHAFIPPWLLDPPWSHFTSIHACILCVHVHVDT